MTTVERARWEHHFAAGLGFRRTGIPAEERRHIGPAHDDVGVLTEGWPEGRWYDLDDGLRCFVLRTGR
ncbi:hypothetical protein [Streptomyces venetus]|uniref:hypothetical protein n=1 Tax=Streptomyces venetus TaxID=1701086 RepID=UPI003C2DC35E